jgi:hypothetical protein
MEYLKMSEYSKIGNHPAEDLVDETMDLLNSLSNRTGDTAESIAELADEMEELCCEIKSLLDDLRTLQSRIAQPNRKRLDSLIDQLEGVYRGLETAVWTMDCTREGLPEDTDLLEILGLPIGSFD